MGKRYFWLRLKEDFFDEIYVKALRKLPQGDSLVVVFLKLQLRSMNTNGLLEYKRIMPNAITELALAIDEDETIVQLTVEALARFGVIEYMDNDDLYITTVKELVGSETADAKRMRENRKQKSNKKLTNIEQDEQCSNNVQKCSNNFEYCSTEKNEKKEDKEQTRKEQDYSKSESKSEKSVSVSLSNHNEDNIEYSDIKDNEIRAVLSSNLLTPKQVQALLERIDKASLLKYIQKAQCYIEQGGHYRDVFATINSWIDKDTQPKPNSSDTIGEEIIFLKKRIEALKQLGCDTTIDETRLAELEKQYGHVDIKVKVAPKKSSGSGDYSCSAFDNIDYDYSEQ